MKLSKLLKNLPDKSFKYKIFGNTEIEVFGVTNNTKDVRKGFIFVAIKGIHIDSHDLIKESIFLGSPVVVCEDLPEDYLGMNAVFVKVDNSRKALALLASSWYGNPFKKLKIIGVTGTKGKTTTVEIIYHILKSAGKKVGAISTVNATIGNKTYDTGLHVTNPEAMDLHMLFKKMVDYGCKYAILEVTSHGIDQDRVGGINYEMGILTNISPEHLDYHKTFKNYQRVKSQLFLRSKVSILNRDDSSFDFINNEVKNNSKVISYGFKNKSDYFGTIGKNKKFCINIKTFEENKNININLPGEFNAYNCLAAIVAAKELNIGWKDISKSLRTLPQIKGRLEEVVNSKGFKIYIDFAHTSDSLENVLKLLRGMTEGNLILVFGCAGERDPLKRPKMGEISAKYADISIITSEDPRSEKVNTIISEIESGAKKLSVRVKNDDKFEKLKAKISGHIYFKIPERGEAIYFAIQKIARRGDIVVICGKGHEKSMSYSGVEYPWSDYEAVESALNGRAKIIIRS